MRKTVLFMTALLLLASCGLSYEEKKRVTRAEHARVAREDSLSLKIGVLPTLDALPVYVAYETQLFDTLGLTVHLKQRKAQMDCDTALMGGSMEGAFSDKERLQYMQSKGAQLISMGQTGLYWQLIANRKARVKEVSQLGDKMVAMTRFSATDYLTDRALKGVKTRAMVFKVQINDVNLRLKMLLNNEMDAVWLPEPQATTARLFHNPVLKDSREMKEHLGILVARQETLTDQNRRKQWTQFIKAYNRACDSLNNRGLKHYSALIIKYCDTDARTVKELPKMSFTHLPQLEPLKDVK